MTVYQSFFSIQLSLCKLFPALTPFLIRREKAVDVFQLVKRIQEKNEYERIKELGITNYPICIAKTQYSFSADAKAYGCPTGFNIHIRDIVVNCGAEMLVLVAGDIMRMPGLPRSPQAERIDLVDGEIVGLS